MGAVALLVGVVAIGCGDAAPTESSQAVFDRAAAKAAEVAQRYGVAPLPPEGLDLDTPFGKLHLQDHGLHRSLMFVRDDETLALQTMINLAQPHVLMLPYSRVMFASYLFVPEPSRVLIVGLGGGAMVRYLAHRDPDLWIDAVDIDPDVVAIADTYFGTRSSERVQLRVADGYEVIRTAGEPYDVIYMDAFLRPTDETDRSGNPLRMKEGSFYEALRARLTPDGVIVFNLNPQPERANDIVELRRSFPQLYVFDVEKDDILVAVATQEQSRRSPSELATSAAALPPRFEGDVAFTDVIERLEPAI